MIPIAKDIVFSLLPVESDADSLLQEMKDDDDFFFEPLPLERQETIRDETPGVSEEASIFREQERTEGKYYSSDKYLSRKP